MHALRQLACLSVAALGAATGLAHAQSAATAEWRPPLAAPEFNRATKDSLLPRWVLEPLSPANDARIATILEGHADVVVLNSGYYQGFRNGAVCQVQRDNGPVAKLIVVAAQETRSAALILNQPATVILVPGDEVRLSTL
ncbi:MAG TPA: hypothetical protein VHC95_07930 [Opitutales bacterium]|nr:hypothetical protein [Opitutales bacterium]